MLQPTAARLADIMPSGHSFRSLDGLEAAGIAATPDDLRALQRGRAAAGRSTCAT